MHDYSAQALDAPVAESWADCKENRQSMAAKGPPFGHVDIFQTSPSPPVRNRAKISAPRGLKFFVSPPSAQNSPYPLHVPVQLFPFPYIIYRLHL